MLKFLLFSNFLSIIHIISSKDSNHSLSLGLFYTFAALIQVQLIVFYFSETIVTINGFQFGSIGKLGMDGISLWLVWLISVLMPIILLSTFGGSAPSSTMNMFRTLISLLFVISFWSYAVFLVLDLLLFYISFEGVLIPMFFLIGFYGGRNRKIHAANQFFIYTLLGSLVLLIALVLVSLESGLSNYFTNISTNISEISQYLLWAAFFFALAIKIPMVPMHIWLPEAHVEAPTCASVLLAAILLKLGSFGLLRYCLPMFPEASKELSAFVGTLCLIGILYSSFSCLALWDMKKLIAYSSIGHMNIATLAIFTNDVLGMYAGIFFLISHGIISSALFILIGILYDRFHTRTIKYYRGISSIMPNFIFFMLIFTFANIAVPGTSGFICEFLTFLSVFNWNPFLGILSSSVIVLAPAYSLWVFHKIAYGTISSHFSALWSDISYREFNILLPLLFFMLLLGLHPDYILETLFNSSTILLS